MTAASAHAASTQALVAARAAVRALDPLNSEDERADAAAAAVAAASSARAAANLPEDNDEAGA